MSALGWLRALFWRPLIDIESLPPLPRRPRKQRVARKPHITDTLNELEATFEHVRRADVHATNDRSLRSALRALGPYFPPPASEILDTDHVVDSIDLHKLPSLAFVALNGSSHERPSSNLLRCDFIYALKLSKLPWDTQQVAGIAFYECGFAWHDGERGLVWSHFHAAVDAERRITIPRVLRRISQRVGSGWRRDVIVRMAWRAPEVFDHMEHRQEAGVATLSDALQFWANRDSYWQVSARRDGTRVTFCIPDNEAKHYFKDRDASAATPGGQRKRIIHYVREHVRATGAEVRAHIRGLRQFDWNGFFCSVVAPQFHHSLATSITLGAVPGDHAQKNGRYIDHERLAKALADADDEQTLNPLRAIRHGRTFDEIEREHSEFPA